MDEMRIVSKFMRGVISKIVKVTIHKKTGYNVDIQINECDVTINDRKAHLHINVDAQLSKDELMRILKELGV